MSGAAASRRQISPKRRQMSLKNEDIAVFALYSLGGISRKVHLEEVAKECHRLAPDRFGWEMRQFKDFGPDKRAGYYALADAKKRQLVRSTGTRSNGGEKFEITSKGVKWIERNGQQIANALNSKRAINPKKQMREILKNIKNDQAFQRFIADGSVDKLSIYDLVDFLGSSYETSPTRIRKKFAEMKEKAELTEDPQIIAFIRAFESEARFARLLRSVGG